jgi:thimet oligopeptidase
LISNKAVIYDDWPDTETNFMKIRFSNVVTGALIAILGGCGSPSSTPPPAAPENLTLADFQSAAARYHSIITVPTFETTASAIESSGKLTVAQAQAALDKVGSLQPAQVTFANTIQALDNVGYVIALAENRLNVIKETSQDAAVRDAATEQLKTLESWAVGLDYREDVYRAVKAYADTHPSLAGEDAKLLTDTLRDYRRAGLELPRAQRDEVEALRKKLSGLTEDFKSNVTKAERRLVFTRAEMEGVPEDFLDQKGVKNDDGTCAVMANITWHYITVMENAKNEQTRLKMETARGQLAVAENTPLLQQILVVRDTIAKDLGYKTWADFAIEIKMAKTAAQATDFLERLNVGLQPKFDSEIAEFRALKIKETGDANAQIHLWTGVTLPINSRRKNTLSMRTP